MKARICDRCESVIYEDEEVHYIVVAISEHEELPIPSEDSETESKRTYGFGKKEVCPLCAEECVALAKKMKLGPDKVKGGIRRRAKRGTGKPRKPRNGKKGEPKAPSKPAKPEE